MKRPFSNADGVEGIHFKPFKSRLSAVTSSSDINLCPWGMSLWFQGLTGALCPPSLCCGGDSSTYPQEKLPQPSPALPTPGFAALRSAQSKAGPAALSQIKYLSHIHRCAHLVYSDQDLNSSPVPNLISWSHPHLCSSCTPQIKILTAALSQIKYHSHVHRCSHPADPRARLDWQLCPKLNISATSTSAGVLICTPCIL